MVTPSPATVHTGAPAVLGNDGAKGVTGGVAAGTVRVGLGRWLGVP